MADPGGRQASPESELVPVVKDGQEVEVWRDVLEFKVHQEQKTEQARDGSGGKPSGSWEIVDSSNASECGSPARTLPASDAVLSEQSSGQGELMPEFQEVHARALAEIEANEAAERETATGTFARGSTPLPVSTDAGRIQTLGVQVLSGSSDTSSGPPGPPGPYENLSIRALGTEQSLDVPVLADQVDPALETRSAEEYDGYCSTEDIAGIEARHVKSEPDSHEAMLELQELSQEGSLDGNYWPECSCANPYGEGEGGVQTPCQGMESFQDVRLAEGAFSEMSFDSPTVLKDAPQQHRAPDDLFSLGGTPLESKAGGSNAGKPATKADSGLEGSSDLPDETLWLGPKTHQFFQRWTAVIMDLLPQMTGSHCLSVVNVAMCRVDWKGVAYNAGLAVLSALVVGLFVQNRRLTHELRKKHEEVSRLMKALMNFQELWSSHRMGKVPIIRHANFSHVTPHRPF